MTTHTADQTYAAPEWAVRSVRTDRSATTYLCGTALGLPAASNLFDHGLLSLIPAALAGFCLLLAFVWMARRWGLRPATTSGPTSGATPAPVPSLLVEDEGNRELVLQD